MKNKSRDSKEPHKTALNLELSWEKITDMESSLRRTLPTTVTLPLSHEHIETLIKFSKETVKAIEAVKAQQKHYQSIQENYNMVQSKLANHDSIVSGLEQHHMQRLKALSDEIKNSKEHYEKGRRNLQESEEQARRQYEEVKNQNTELKVKIQALLKQKQELNAKLKEKQDYIRQLQDHKQRFLAVSTTFHQQPPKPNTPSLTNLLCSSLAHRVASYLPPSDIVALQLLSKQCRVYLSKSKRVQNCLGSNVIRVKNRQIAYFHKHIDYFEKLYHKIPEEILQFTFYRYEILKESIGVEILPILSSSANLFEGKFTDVDDEEQKEKSKDQLREIESEGGSQVVVIGGMAINIEKEIRSVQDFNAENSFNLLEIDEEIVRQFLEDRKNSQEKINREINLMYKSIQQSAQLYSADVESIGLFLKNILKNFSKVFVASKNLYAQSRNLQLLNNFLLRELANWDKMQVEKNSKIEDLRAELQAERKLRQFFKQKSIQSEQRALAQENIKLNIETKYLKQAQKLDVICKQKQTLQAKLAECVKDIKTLKGDNKQIRKAYESAKQKYNKILEELSVVKETILRMNIM